MDQSEVGSTSGRGIPRVSELDAKRSEKDDPSDVLWVSPVRTRLGAVWLRYGTATGLVAQYNTFQRRSLESSNEFSFCVTAAALSAPVNAGPLHR